MIDLMNMTRRLDLEQALSHNRRSGCIRLGSFDLEVHGYIWSNHCCDPMLADLGDSEKIQRTQILTFRYTHIYRTTNILVETLRMYKSMPNSLNPPANPSRNPLLNPHLIVRCAASLSYPDESEMEDAVEVKWSDDGCPIL